MPTLGLSNTIALKHLADPNRDYPIVRVGARGVRNAGQPWARGRVMVVAWSGLPCHTVLFGDEKPFFAYLSFQVTHWPCQAPRACIEKFKGQYREGWYAVRRRRFEKMKRLGIISENLDLPPQYDVVPEWDSLTDDERAFQARTMAVYAAMLHNMDANIGCLVQYLKQIEQYENTLILFLSDNGKRKSESTWLYFRAESARRWDPAGALMSQSRFVDGKLLTTYPHDQGDSEERDDDDPN